MVVHAVGLGLGELLNGQTRILLRVKKGTTGKNWVFLSKRG